MLLHKHLKQENEAVNLSPGTWKHLEEDPSDFFNLLAEESESLARSAEQEGNTISFLHHNAQASAYYRVRNILLDFKLLPTNN